MTNKIKDIVSGLNIVFSNKSYLILFIALVIIFTFLYSFAWNLISIFPKFYIQTFLWNFQNILLLIVIVILSSLAITLSIFNLKMKIGNYKSIYGLLAIIPAFFISGCSACIPLLLSFTSTTFAIGLSLIQFEFIIKILTISILLITNLYLSLIICKCKICECKKCRC